jgi:PKD repeat protein
MRTLVSLCLPVLITIFFVSGCKKDDSDDVIACFSYSSTEITANEYQFKNCSENAESFLWDFGDGKSSNEKDPKHTFEGPHPFSVTLVAINGRKKDTIIKQIPSEIMVLKPNIYIYPLSPISLSVNITFPLGGSVTKSIPEYNNGWTVSIENNGLINNELNYLFYESKQPDLFQVKKGWCVAKADLKTFFKGNMGLYHFSNSEITDFVEYWIPKLTEYNYYLIYPQTNEDIDKTIQLIFSTKPNHVNRLFYGVTGINENTKIEEPAIVDFKRDGFFVMEWGVFFK